MLGVGSTLIDAHLERFNFPFFFSFLRRGLADHHWEKGRYFIFPLESRTNTIGSDRFVAFNCRPFCVWNRIPFCNASLLFYKESFGFDGEDRFKLSVLLRQMIVFRSKTLRPK